MNRFQVTVLPLTNHPGMYTFAITRKRITNGEVGTQSYPTSGEARAVLVDPRDRPVGRIVGARRGIDGIVWTLKCSTFESAKEGSQLEQFIATRDRRHAEREDSPTSWT